MKKTILLTYFSVALMVSAYGQWSFNVTGGLSLATFGGSDAERWGETYSKPDIALRYFIGSQASRLLTESLRVEAGILFSTKGAKYSTVTQVFDPSNQGLQDVEIAYNKVLSYIDIPVSVRYALSQKLNLHGGLQPSILINARVKNNDAAQNAYELPKTENANDQYKVFDAALVLGASYAITDDIALMLAYNHGLLKIGTYEDTTYSIFNRILNVSIVYTFKK